MVLFAFHQLTQVIGFLIKGGKKVSPQFFDFKLGLSQLTGQITLAVQFFQTLLQLV